MSAPTPPPVPNPAPNTPPPTAAAGATTPTTTPAPAPAPSTPTSATATPAPSTNAAPPNAQPAATPPPNQPPSDEQIKALKAAKSQYRRARVTQIFGRMRRHVQFFIVCALFLFATIWMFANAWQQEKAGENENWFHEGLFLFLMVVFLIVFYFRLYRKSEVFLAAQAKREAAEKAAQEAKIKLEEEQKRQAFMGLIKDFQAASTYEQKSTAMAKLLTVGLESNLLRQQAVDLLCELNLWMLEQKGFLMNQNLIIWRLKNSLFETSERFTINSSTQDLSIKAINIVEAITKKHLADFAEGRTKDALDLTNRAIPTLTLTAQKIPVGSLKLDKALLWQASFAETTLQNLSFAGADLQTASFWRSQLENVDFAETNLRFAKLRTSLQDVQNLTGPQFFSTKEWELCYLSPEQVSAFFANPKDLPEGAQDQWDSAEPRRRKLYFHLLKTANTLPET